MIMIPSTAIVQLKFSRVTCYSSSKRVGITNIREVMKSQMTDIHPRGKERPFKSKALFLKVLLETVSLRRIGIAYDI